VKLYEIVDQDGKSVLPVAYHEQEEAEQKLIEMQKDGAFSGLMVKEFDRKMEWEG
jgi:hypothetical protein